MARTIDHDKFELTLEEILDTIGKKAGERTPEVIKRGAQRTASYWRSRAKKLWGEKTGKTYRKTGKDYTVGKYSRSIRSHMLDESQEHPSAEVGAPKMAGLVHLLENGHAKVGGGRVPAYVHVDPAAKSGFRYTIELAEKMIDEVLDES